MKRLRSIRTSRATVFVVALAASIAAPAPLIALTSAVWDGSVGNWSDATHWSTNPLFPNNGNGGVDYAVTVLGDGNGNNGVINVDGGYSVTNLTMGLLSRITGNGTLTVTGTLDPGNFGLAYFGDVFGGPAAGTTRGSLVGSNSAINIAPHYTLENTGVGTFTGQTQICCGTLANSGTLIFADGTSLFDDLTLNNSGSIIILQGAGWIFRQGVVHNTGSVTQGDYDFIAAPFNNTGGTVDVSGVFELAGGGSATNDAVFRTWGSGVVSFEGGEFTIAGGTTFVGTGKIRIGQEGRLVINGTVSIPNLNNTAIYPDGGVDVRSGTLDLSGSVANFNGATNTLNGGGWIVSGTGTLSFDVAGGNRPIYALTGGAKVTVGSSTATMTGLQLASIGSNSGLRVIGGATVTTGVTLTSSGSVSVDAGSVLNIGAGGTGAFTQNAGGFGSQIYLAGGTINAGSYVLNGGSIYGYGQMNGPIISGSLSLENNGGLGILILTGANTYSGTTTVNGATLQIGNGGGTGTLGTGTVTDNRLLVFNRSGTLTVANDIIGTGTVTNSGPGILNLDGAQSYRTLNANAGTTKVNGSFTVGNATVNANATTIFGASQKLAALNIANGVVVTFGSGPGPAFGEASVEDASSFVVPEPGVLGFFAVGAISLLGRRRR